MSCQQHSATITIKAQRQDLSKILFLALKPESEEKGKGFSVELFMEEEKIIIRLSAKSLSRLRAVINSYLRWVKSILEVIEGDEINANTNSA
ncbi:MAG: KEOPS complex subunit Pcc1 [Candidatus Nezhaarchaeota archaeon]|nr:KEOPS complex subunit Pcc1 [Candidatus Nezhaarchaeota archaeon]